MKLVKNLIWFAVTAGILVTILSCSSVSQQNQTQRLGNIIPVPRPPAPEFSPNKKRLLNYLNDQFGKVIISGQMDTSWTTNKDMDMIARVFTDTGKYPAIKGFDFIEVKNSYAPSLSGREQMNEAIEWWEGKNNGVRLLPNKPEIHGIVTFCWHWRAGYSNEFYTNKTSFRIPFKNGQLDVNSEDFTSILRDLDRVAERLTSLKERDIPVLWRPLHEAAGGWFWWGATGRNAYIALWEFMYDYFTYVKGLNNLIWVWNGEDSGWMPDLSTIEIVSLDLYKANYSSMKLQFDRARYMTSAREYITALSENDWIPDPDECLRDGTMWSWFMTWNDRFQSVQGETHKDNFWTGEHHNPQAHKMKVYHHPLVITLDELPNLTTYRIE